MVVVNPGYDLFRTQKVTKFHFEPPFIIPPDFFEPGSEPFTDKDIHFRGVPLKQFMGLDTGTADTIIKRTKSANLPDPLPSRDKIPIAIERLSLKSIRPIHVKVGKSIQRWHVEVSEITHPGFYWIDDNNKGDFRRGYL